MVPDTVFRSESRETAENRAARSSPCGGHKIWESACGQTRAALLREVHDFVSETGISEDALGRAAVGSGRVVGNLKAGRGITIDTLDRLRAFMAAERARRAGEAAEAAARGVVPEPVNGRRLRRRALWRYLVERLRRRG